MKEDTFLSIAHSASLHLAHLFLLHCCVASTRTSPLHNLYRPIAPSTAHPAIRLQEAAARVAEKQAAEQSTSSDVRDTQHGWLEKQMDAIERGDAE